MNSEMIDKIVSDNARMEKALKILLKEKRDSFIKHVSKEYDMEYALKHADHEHDICFLKEAIDGYPADKRPNSDTDEEARADPDAPSFEVCSYNGQIEIYEFGIRVAYSTKGGHWIDDCKPVVANKNDPKTKWYDGQVAQILYNSYKSELEL